MIFGPRDILPASREGGSLPGPVRELKHYVFNVSGAFWAGQEMPLRSSGNASEKTKGAQIILIGMLAA